MAYCQYNHHRQDTECPHSQISHSSANEATNSVPTLSDNSYADHSIQQSYYVIHSSYTFIY